MNILKKIGLISILLLLLTGIFIQSATGCASREEVNMPIVLITDYGNDDYRVAQLKGIIYSSNPEARVIDASLGVPAFDIYAGAFVLDIAAKEFPEDTVFISIIAPYEQLEIRYLVLTTSRNQIFVLPDNGLITYIVDNMEIDSVYQVTNQELFDKPLEELTAEPIQGRIGSIIASGYSVDDVGIPVTNPVTLEIQEPEIDNDILLGTVVYVDHYGNCITNIPGDIAGKFNLNSGDIIQVESSDSIIIATFGTIYSDVPEGDEIVFILSSLDMLQLSLNLGDFARTYNIKTGAKIEICRQ